MREVQFLVAAIHREADRVFAAGRNCKEQIVVGDTLHISDHESAEGDAIVRGILTYRRQMNTLDVGMTGELELLTQHADLIVPGCALVGSFQTPAPRPRVLGTGEFHVRPV